jgi:hypothetical protein
LNERIVEEANVTAVSREATRTFYDVVLFSNITKKAYKSDERYTSEDLNLREPRILRWGFPISSAKYIDMGLCSKSINTAKGDTLCQKIFFIPNGFRHIDGLSSMLLQSAAVDSSIPYREFIQNKANLLHCAKFEDNDTENIKEVLKELNEIKIDCHVDSSDKAKISYYDLLQSSKFSIYIDSLNGHEDKDLLEKRILLPLLFGNIPILIEELLSNEEKIFIEDFKSLPIVLIRRNELIATLLSSSLTSIHRNMTTGNIDEKYSISPLFLPFWMQKLVPVEERLSFVSRGMTKYKKWLDQELVTVATSAAAAAAADAKLLRYVDNIHPICDRKDGNSVNYTLEIVIPRCCEWLSGNYTLN